MIAAYFYYAWETNFLWDGSRLDLVTNTQLSKLVVTETENFTISS